MNNDDLHINGLAQKYGNSALAMELMQCGVRPMTQRIAKNSTKQNYF